ncbi:MAG: hypothetical protein ABEK36_02475, partial [Candidatus Aenigmatarchaeota archaeon]
EPDGSGSYCDICGDEGCNDFDACGPNTCPGECDYFWDEGPSPTTEAYCGDTYGCDCWYRDLGFCDTRWTQCQEGECCDCDEECPPGVSCVSSSGDYGCDSGKVCEAACGDGVVSGGEECDGAAGDCGDSSCNPPESTNECQCAECGNGIVEAGEECDDPGSDDCNPAGHPRECQLPSCGNGIIDAGEDCEVDDDCGAGKCVDPGLANECLCEQGCGEYCQSQTYIGDDGQSHNYLSGQCNTTKPESWWEEEGGYAYNRNSVVKYEEKNTNIFSRALAAVGMISGGNGVPVVKPAEVVDCRDNFKKGNVKIKELSLRQKDISAGDIIAFKGSVVNKNNFSVADGLIYAKLHRKNQDKKSRDYLVDDFLVAEDINLWPGEKKSFSFSRKISPEAISGEYIMSFYFIGSDQFQLSGTTFLPKLAETSKNFRIKGKSEGMWIDSSNITVNGKKKKNITSVPVVEKGKDLTISFPVKDTSGGGEITIFADVYDYDAIRREKIINRHHKEKKIFIEGQEEIVEFKFSDLEPGSYVFKALAKRKRKKSLLDLRFTVPGNTAKILHSSLSKFPIEKGDNFTLSSCFANSTDMSIYFQDFQGKVVVRLEDKDSGERLAQMTYEGEITLEPIGLKKEFTANRSSENIVLVVQAYNPQGELLDEVRTDYNLDSFSKREQKETETEYLKIILLSLGVIISLIAIFFIIKKELGKKNIKILFVVLLLLVGLTVSLGVYAAITGQANFRCIREEQPCCQYLYNDWQNQGIDWEEIQAYYPLEAMFEESVSLLKASNGSEIASGGSLNVSGGDAVEGNFNSPGGDYMTDGLYFATPPINWVDNIGVDGTPIYYSDPSRVCSTYGSVDDNKCPPNTPDFVGQDSQVFANWCNNEKDSTGAYSPHDSSFNLDTYTVPYTSFGIIPATYSWDSGACIGTQITCERKMTISVNDARMVCTLENSNTGDQCSTSGSGSCSLKATDIDLSCEPRSGAKGAVTITTEQDFDCFAYLDRGVFVQIEDGATHEWEEKGNPATLCQPFGEAGSCYCEKKMLQGKVEEQACHGLYYPLKMESFSGDPADVTKEYTIDIVDSKLELESHQVYPDWPY